MSTASDGPGQLISLPSGGGALHGLGEKFAPDLHTGTGNFSVPLALPPGRNGFQPQLTLVYSTGNGNGPFGLGWNLSVPGVSRRTARGVPRYDDTDTFLLSGAEDLVRVGEPAPGVARYRPRTEGLFARIEHHRESGNDYWEVRSRDGLVSLYGTPGATSDDPAVVAEPADRARVFMWKLTRTIDPFGNRIEYEYSRDLGEDGSHRWDQLYLRRIRYLDYTDPAGETGFLVSVTFDHGNVDRPDPFSEYRPGFEIRTRRRYDRVEVRTHADAERLVRTYRLVYLDQRPELENLRPLNGVSLLSQLRVIGHDGDAVEELAPLEFRYTRFEPQTRDFFPVQSTDLPRRFLAHPDFELVDLFGSGLPDVLEMNGTVRFWRNRGGGRYDLPHEMALAPAGVRLADPGVQLLDANGDGRTDLVVTAGPLPGYYPLRFGGGWDRRSFHPYRAAPSFSLEDPEVRLVDLDGDGVTDAVRSGSRLECFFNDPREGWSRTRWVERRSLEGLPTVSFSDPRVRWADMSGDGLQDLVLVHDGNVEYWPNLGHGDWGPRVSMRSSPRFPLGYDPRRILVGDVDGDGAADLVYVDHRRILLHINQSGRGWSEPIEIQGTPPVSDLDSVRLVDLLGNGVAGVLWSTDSGRAGEGLYFLDLTGGVKPYLLNEVDNQMGAVTRVEYAPSTRFYLADEQRPETRWQTPLPFPMQVVARLEVVDQLSAGKLTTEYRYHHGYWDGAEREFHGFGAVEELDTETFQRYHESALHATDMGFAPVEVAHFSPPTLTKTWFHQGAIGEASGQWYEADYRHEFWPGDPPLLLRPPLVVDLLRRSPRPARRDALRALRGSVLRTELYALDGTDREDRPYTVTESVYGLREEAPPSPGDGERPRIFFPYTVAQRTTQWERGDDPLTQYTFTDGYDALGRPGQQTTVAPPRREARRQAAGGGDETRILATHTRTEYATPDADLYLHDRVAQVRSFDLRNPPGLAESASDDLPRVLMAQVGAAYATHQRFRALVDPWVPGQPLPAAVRLIGHTVSHYDGTPRQAFLGRPPGEVGPYGALTRTESLAFTDEELDEAYGAQRPGYLGGGGVLPPGAPPGFGNGLGYWREQSTATGYHEGYYLDTQRRRFDFHDPVAAQRRGLAIGTQDALSNEVTVHPDSFWALPVEVVDPAGLVTTAVYDYRVLQPTSVTDANGNRTEFTFTPLGLLATTLVRGKPGNQEGDQIRASVRTTYALRAFADSPPDARQPVYARTLRHVHHDTETGVPLPERDDTIESVEYSDGFGRLLQTRTQAEDVLFDDPALPAPIFGDVGLPTASAGPVASAVGRARGADDPPNVIVSGWQAYDNKGRVVEKYEPFFAQGWAFAAPADQERGQRTRVAYDPRGQLIRTLGPDGSEQRVIYGVPRDLTDPDRVSPTPWELYTYDANDNAGRTHTAASAGYSHHWNTPTSALLDALGRTVESVARTRSVQAPAQPPPPVQEHRTRSTYDIQGNLRTATDPLGREILRYAYDLLQHSLRVTSLDAGTRLTVLDAQANPVEQRDGRGAVLLRAFDRLNRPVRVWASDGAGRPLTLRERLEYGDGGDPAQTPGERDAGRATNRLGKLFRYYDEAGLLTFESYAFKGNVLERTRRVISDASLLAPGGGAGGPESSFQVDWEPPQGTSLAEHAENILDPTEFRTSFTYDALARVTALGYPQGVDGERRRLRPLYNRAGTLTGVEMDGELYVSRIAYNAKGQRLLVAYANGLMTRYAYDPRMFRLARLRTERFDQVVPNTYQPSGAPLQDLTHGYDLVGNRTTEIDRTPGSGFLNNPDALRFQTSDPQLAQQLAAGNALVRTFRYDPLYRLTAATGREGSTFPAPRPWSDDPRPGYNSGSHGTPSQDSAPNLTAGYLESYAYDPAGNLVTMRHDSAAGATWTRHFGVGGLTPAQWQQEWQARLNAAGPWPNPPGNPLTHVGDDQPGVPQTHDFDANGNLTSETTSRHFEWDHSNRMRGFRVQAGAGPPSLQAQYLYDGRGQRVKKLVRRAGNGYDVTVYLEGGFEHHRQVRPSGIQENNTLHVMDDRSRIASVRVGAAFPDDGAPGVRVRYHLGDHLGSVTLLIGGAAASAATFINREEYFPYGETSFGSFGRKRYRFVGKERDEESGLYYCEARYYAAPFGRWASCDPLGLQGNGDHNLYRYVRGNPLRLVDPTGKEEGEAFVNLGTRQEGRGVPRAGPLRGPGGPLEGLKLISLEEVQAAQGGPKINLGKLGPLRGSAAYVSRVLQGEFPAVKAIRVDLKGLAQLLESELKNPTTAARGGASRFHAFEEFRAIRRLFARGETAKVDIVFTNEVGENFLVKKGTSIIEQVKTPGAGSSALRTGGLVLGTTLGLIFSGLGGLHVGGGIDDITQGKGAEGLNKVITGGTGLVVSLGGAKAVEAGLISAGAGAGGLFLAGLAFGGSLVLAEQSVEAGLKNQDTPLEIAEKHYFGFSGTQMYGQPLSQSWREFKAAFGHLWR